MEREIRRARKQPEISVWELVQSATDLEEHQFIDAVERRLRHGRLMILIIGDGIQEGVEALTAHLQLHAGIHAGMALVDLSIWEDATGGMIVVPRVPMRTVLVERGIVIADGVPGVKIAPPLAAVRQPTTPKTPKSVTASEPEFYAQLDERRPGLASQLRDFLESVVDLGVIAEFRTCCVLRWNIGPDAEGSAGYIDKTGKVWLSGALTNAKRRGFQEVGWAYLERMAREIGGSVRRYKNGDGEVLDANGHGPDLFNLLEHAGTWRQAIAELIEATKDPEV